MRLAMTLLSVVVGQPSLNNSTRRLQSPTCANPVTFTEHIVTTTADLVSNAYAADLDNDGDMDVLSASRLDDTIAWYENVGGTFHKITITTTADYADFVYAADVNGDGRMDVLTASFGDDTIAWYENDGGDPPFFTQRTITTTANGADCVIAVDLDNDGDLDVVSASYFDDTVAWYENIGGSPPTFTQRIITTTANGAESVWAADLDGDGDLDVLSASWNDDTVAWYENDGGSPPTFTTRVITTTADWAYSVYAADLDGDGDLDVLSASWRDNTIAWYENNGGSPLSFIPWVITTTADGAQSVFAADMDNDGDMDVLAASALDDTIAWYENDGSVNPSFTQRVITATADWAMSVYAVDMDNDGDVDVVSASSTDDTVAWYENNCVLATPTPTRTPTLLVPSSYSPPSPFSAPTIVPKPQPTFSPKPSATPTSPMPSSTPSPTLSPAPKATEPRTPSSSNSDKGALHTKEWLWGMLAVFVAVIGIVPICRDIQRDPEDRIFPRTDYILCGFCTCCSPSGDGSVSCCTRVPYLPPKQAGAPVCDQGPQHTDPPNGANDIELAHAQSIPVAQATTAALAPDLQIKNVSILPN